MRERKTHQLNNKKIKKMRENKKNLQDIKMVKLKEKLENKC